MLYEHEAQQLKDTIDMLLAARYRLAVWQQSQQKLVGTPDSPVTLADEDRLAEALALVTKAVWATEELSDRLGDDALPLDRFVEVFDGQRIEVTYGAQTWVLNRADDPDTFDTVYLNCLLGGGNAYSTDVVTALHREGYDEVFCEYFDYDFMPECGDADQSARPALLTGQLGTRWFDDVVKVEVR